MARKSWLCKDLESIPGDSKCKAPWGMGAWSLGGMEERPVWLKLSEKGDE